MDNLFCENCEKPIQNEFNFCPYCGKTLTQTAKRLNKEKYAIVKLKLLNELSEEITDKNSLKIIAKVAEKISK